MDTRLTKKLTYPEVTTFETIRMSLAPGEGDVPPEGTTYEWRTVVEGVTYINVKYSDGTVKAYSLDPDVNSWQPPDSYSQMDDSMEFTANDISEGVLTIPNVKVVSDIGFYTDSTKASRTIVSLPITVEAENTIISFENVGASDYQYGGKIRFTRGIVYLYSEDFTYLVPSAQGYYQFDASLGYTQIVNNILNDLYINKNAISNLPENKLLKIIVNNASDYSVIVDGEECIYAKFFMCYMNLGGTVVRIGEPTEIH